MYVLLFFDIMFQILDPKSEKQKLILCFLFLFLDGNDHACM